MIEVLIKFKEVKYPKTFGKTTGGLFTNAILKIDENTMRFEHNNFKIIKYLANQLPIEFDKNFNQPKKVYINEFNEYKIKYSTTFKDCEITFKLKEEITPEFVNLFVSWKK